MPGQRDTATMAYADQVAADLGDTDASGGDWRTAVPPDARIAYDGDPVMADQVVTDAGERIVRRSNAAGEVWWTTIGWSDASKAMLYRPVPHSPRREIEQMHTDDDGAP